MTSQVALFTFFKKFEYLDKPERQKLSIGTSYFVILSDLTNNVINKLLGL